MLKHYKVLQSTVQGMLPFDVTVHVSVGKCTFSSSFIVEMFYMGGKGNICMFSHYINIKS